MYIEKSKYPHPDDWMTESVQFNFQEMPAPEPLVRQHLTRFDNTLFEHLLKLFYFREDTNDYNGWCNSVFKCTKFVKKIQNTKGKDKFPEPSKISKWLWGEDEDCFRGRHAGCLEDFNDKTKDDYKYLPSIPNGGDIVNARNFVKAYIDWLADELSLNGYTSNRNVNTAITGLLKIYKYRSK